MAKHSELALIAALDEVGTETQLSDGWTYAVLPADAVLPFESLISCCRTKNFHGKKFKDSERDDYRSFLCAMRTSLEAAPVGFLAFKLLSRPWRSEYDAFMERLVEGGMLAAGVADQDAAKICRHVFPALGILQRLLGQDSNGVSNGLLSIEIDSDDISARLAQSNVQVRGREIPTGKLLTTAYSAYREKQFPRSPTLPAGGICVMRDKKSRMIQMADVFGNFALAHLFVKLGDTSRKRRAKAELFRDVFGDILGTDEDVTSKCRLVDGNDIECPDGECALFIG